MKFTLPFALTIAAATLLSGSSAMAVDASSTACSRTASKMLSACRFEENDKYNSTLGSCINLYDQQERTECRDAAAEARHENIRNCRAQKSARLDVCDLLQENRYDPEPLTEVMIHFIDPDDIGDSASPNPYFSLQAGHTYVARAGEGFEETVVVHVTDKVRQILGVDCRLVVDIVLLSEDSDYVAVEVTDDYYAQSSENDVYYCGETARNFEDGVLRDLDGSFEAGRDLAKSGILIKAAPDADDAHRQEYLLGEAEDAIRYVGDAEAPTEAEGGDNPIDAFNCSINGGCLKTEEFIPPQPGAGEFKYFLADTGFVLGVALEDGTPTGERDELVCVGDSLDILADESCGIENLAGLQAELCRLSPDAFCEED